MRSPSNRQRLGQALLVSLCLHLVLLLPGSPRPPLRVGADTTATQALILNTFRPAPLIFTSGEIAPDQAPSPQTSRPDLQGYHSAEQLTHPPRPLQDVNLELPESSLLTGPGSLRLTLWIDAEGRVVSFQVEAPDLPEEYTTAVAEAFSAMRFAPGEILGRKVASILRIEVRHETSTGKGP